MSQEPVKIVIVLDGGILQGVTTCGIPVEYVVIDYDIDGAEDTFQVPQGDGTFVDACVYASLAENTETSYAFEVFNLVKAHQERE